MHESPSAETGALTLILATRTAPASGKCRPPLLVLSREKYESFWTASVCNSINSPGLSALIDPCCFMKTAVPSSCGQMAEWTTSYFHIRSFRSQNYFPFNFLVCLCSYSVYPVKHMQNVFRISLLRAFLIIKIG